MKIVFMGTPDFARKSLEKLYETDNQIMAIVTNTDKKKGRGMKVIKSPVKEFAEEKNIRIYQPETVKNNEEFAKELASLEPDLFVVVAYGKILPKEILEIPKYGSINVHGSLLPKYRGAAPIQWAVINGEKETGVTTMFMDIGMDTGDMILKETVPISENETTGELWKELSNVGAELLVKTIDKIETAIQQLSDSDITENKEADKNNENKNEGNESQEEHNNKNKIKQKIKELVGATKQGNDYTIAPMINKEMAQIDWNKSGAEIKNLVRGLDPIMGAYTFYKGKKLKIWNADTLKDEAELTEIDATLQDNESAENGEILFADKKKGLYVKTGNGTLKILELQAENSKRMNIRDFMNGNQMQVGEVLKWN